MDAGARRCRGADRQIVAAHGGQHRRRAPLQLAGVDRPQRLRHAERRVPIHGTTDLARLGGPASHGCVRLHPSHAAALFALVQRTGPRNTRIEIN
jgi:lipoprotein-anchoring transpeptidase ErfK/SrfK